jgi:transcriptional regulator with XRE-family HTH domain
MEIGQRLARNMKRLRRERGWSQEELGDRSGLHRTYISQLERVAKVASINAVDKLAGAFGVQVGELLH